MRPRGASSFRAASGNWVSSARSASPFVRPVTACAWAPRDACSCAWPMRTGWICVPCLGRAWMTRPWAGPWPPPCCASRAATPFTGNPCPRAWPCRVSGVEVLDVGAKITTLREAKAEGFLRLEPATLERLKRGETPKPDVLATARAAALLAAKKTPELIPHCHPISLEAVSVDLVPEAGGIRVSATATAIARTGVEMEALCAVQVACLVLYDMLKAVDHNMVIEGVRLLEKSGGKDDFIPDLRPGYKAAVVVTSDRVSQGEAEDKTGPWLVGRLKDFGVQYPAYHLVPDEEA